MLPLLIVNPRSSGGRTGRVFEKMRGPIERHIGRFDVSFTERPRHAAEIAREASLAGREVVIAVGGDGSIHEVVSGLMRARAEGAGRTRLGIIGQGTGGDFRKTLGIEHRLDRYCETIAAGRTRAVDVGKFSHGTDGGGTGTAYFMNILSVGLGGLLDRRVATSSRAMGGTVAYFAAGIRSLSECVVGRLACTIELDGARREEEVDTRVMAICNGRFFGGGMKVAPMARLDDGVFEVVDLGGKTLPELVGAALKMYAAKHLTHPSVRHYRCDKLSLRLLDEGVADRFLLDVDGEAFGRMPIEVEVVPGAIDVLAP